MATPPRVAIRAVVGARPVISAAMDLHGNVSPQLFADCDLLTCYRTAPHVDVWETRERALRGLLDALRRGVRPAKALAHVPLLLPGEMTSTRMEPARSLYARLDSVDALPGIVDAALWIGDCTACLAALLAEPRVVDGDVSAVVASIVDPAAVKQAEAVGVGNEAQFTIGARIDTRAPGPQRLRAVVETATADPGTGQHTVCLRAGGLRVIVTSAREQFSTLAQFRRAGVDPATTDIIVVKMGYLEPELYDLQRGWLLALTPGGVDQDLRRLGHRRVTRPMIPFDADAPEPAGLTAACDARAV